MKTLVAFLAFFAVAYFGAQLVGRAMDIQTCETVQEESHEHLARFYITGDEKAACDRRGVQIDASVPVYYTDSDYVPYATK